MYEKKSSQHITELGSISDLLQTWKLAYSSTNSRNRIENINKIKVSLIVTSAMIPNAHLIMPFCNRHTENNLNVAFTTFSIYTLTVYILYGSNVRKIAVTISGSLNFDHKRFIKSHNKNVVTLNNAFALNKGISAELAAIRWRSSNAFICSLPFAASFAIFW